MKHQIIWLALVLAIQVNAQSEVAGKKVVEAFGQSEVVKMNEGEILWQNFLADKMCIIQEISTDKNVDYTEISLTGSGKLNLSELTTENFNPFVYGITPIQSEHQYLKIAGSDKIIFVYSMDRLRVMYERHLTNLKKS